MPLLHTSIILYIIIVHFLLTVMLYEYPCVKDSTWVIVEDDVEEVLVPPGDVVLVFLVKWM